MLFTVEGSFGKLDGSVTDRNGKYTYSSGELELSSEHSTHASGVTKRRDSIKNVSDKPVSLRSALSKFTLSGGEYEVYTQYSEWCGEGKGGWQRLNTEIAAESEEVRGNSCAAPFVAIYNKQNGRGTVFHIIHSSLWEIRVKRCFRQCGGFIKDVTVELGIRERGFEYTLLPGDSLQLPEILYYEFENKTDMAAYKLHRYFNAVYPARDIPIVYNTWLSKLDNISPELLTAQLERARYIGAEYFVIDAGWFGEPGKWYGSVGDWKECLSGSMKGRMNEFAELVRKSGMKFGLWFEIERAMLTSNAFKEHPEDYITEGGFAFVDFASKAARDRAFETVSAQIKRYGIEFIKFDFNAELAYDPRSHSFIDYLNGYAEFIKRLREEHPQVYLECCASGGLRMTLYALTSGFDSAWMSDNHSLYEQLRIFKETLLRMPSRSLEHWITVTSGDVNGISDKILVSGDAGWGHIEAVNGDYMRACTLGGPLGITCDLTLHSDRLTELLKKHVEEYKAERAFWRESECHILCDTESALVLQFCDKSTERIKICAYFARPSQGEMTVYPYIEGERSYMLNGAPVTSEQLRDDGIEISVPGAFGARVTELYATKI